MPTPSVRQRTHDELPVPLPIFDFGDAARSRAESTYMVGFNRAAKLAVDASSQVREHYGAHRTAYNIAKHSSPISHRACWSGDEAS